jgi:hypothetical protein
MSDNYDDIINLPHFSSGSRPHMPLHDRAAQFAPFKALTGYEDSIFESERRTDRKLELSESQNQALNNSLNELEKILAYLPEICVEFFIPDNKKEGGAYVKYTGNLRLIDRVNKKLIFSDGFTVNLDDIFTVESNYLTPQD